MFRTLMSVCDPPSCMGPPDDARKALYRFWVGLAAAFLILGCSGAQRHQDKDRDALPSAAWQTKLNQDNPLVGLIWDSRLNKTISSRQLVKQVAKAQLILIGERHDHPDHHRIQAWLIDNITDQRTVGFEMLARPLQDALQAAKNASDVEALSQWEKSGWPAFSIYKPIFDAAYRGQHELAAIHPTRKQVKAVLMGLSAGELAKGHMSALPRDGLKALKADIKASHCGHANPQMTQAMTRAQVFKDQFMLRNLIEKSGDKGSVLIAGNGHVRKDYGIPVHAPADLRTVSIGIIEAGRTLDVARYGPERFDYVFFTPMLDDVDPCVQFREALKKIKQKK
ncbi:MAG: ChaN family lipoprotein [Bradymonadia bacterium]